jgi:hypothetical protein
LFADVVNGGPLDLSRRDSAETVDQEAALTIVASRRADVFRPHQRALPTEPLGELRVNPLYAGEPHGDGMRFRLRFPSEDYEQEYGACRQYLPESFALDRASLDAIASGRVPPDMADFVQRKVLVDLDRETVLLRGWWNDHRPTCPSPGCSPLDGHEPRRSVQRCWRTSRARRPPPDTRRAGSGDSSG